MSQKSKDIQAALDYAKLEIDLIRKSRYWLQCPICASFISSQDWEGVTIYRSSDRSQTVKCRKCGFQFTYTYHKLKQALVNMTNHVKNKKEYLEKMNILIKCLDDVSPTEKRGKYK
jgi:hypothetical protein